MDQGSSGLRHVAIDRAGKVVSEETVPIVPNEFPQEGRAVVDSGGDLALVFFDGVGFTYEFRNASGWSAPSAVNVDCFEPAYAFDSNNHPLVACASNGVLTPAGITLISFDGSTWGSETVTTQGVPGDSIAVGTDGSIQIVYAVVGSQNLIYAIKRAGLWTFTDTGVTAAGHAVLGLDSGNNPGILYPSLSGVCTPTSTGASGPPRRSFHPAPTHFLLVFFLVPATSQLPS